MALLAEEGEPEELRASGAEGREFQKVGMAARSVLPPGGDGENRPRLETSTDLILYLRRLD